MKSDKYVVSLGVAKGLKGHGFEQGGCDAYWHCINMSYLDRCRKGYGLTTGVCKELEVGDYYLSNSDHIYGAVKIAAAPCVGRLGEELPSHFCISELGNMDYRECRNDGSQGYRRYIISYVSDKNCANNILVGGNTEADARGLMWIELKKKGLL